MPRNGGGTYTLPQPAFVPSTTISSAAVNSDFSDIATALTNSIASNGETPITGPLKFPSGTAAFPAVTFSSDDTTGMYYPGANQVGLSAGGVEAVILDTSHIGAGQDGNILQYPGGVFPSPVGAVIAFAGSTAPVGWFLCYGQSLSTTSYPELYTVIGTTYGSGAGTFNVPDLRGRAVFGKDNMGGSAANHITNAVSGITGTTLGASGGAQSVTIAQANFPSAVTLTTTIASGQGSHTHTVTASVNTVPNVSGGGFANVGGVATSTTTAAATLPAMTGTTPLGGSGTALAVMPPTLILNYIIFAGRA